MRGLQLTHTMFLRKRFTAVLRDPRLAVLLLTGTVGVIGLYLLALAVQFRLDPPVIALLPVAPSLPPRTYPVMTVPTVGLVSWIFSSLGGTVLFDCDRSGARAQYLSLLLWGSGIFVELLCFLILWLL